MRYFHAMTQATDTADSPDVGANFRRLKDAIAAAAKAVERDPDGVSLVAVSKKHDTARIDAALAAGHRVFGENRVQEAQTKYPEIKKRYPDLSLHLVGPLQTNKAEDAVALFDVIESLDRERLAAALRKAIDKSGGPQPDLFVQVNTGEEPQKAGIAPDDVDAFVTICRSTYGLAVSGLMAIPPVDEEAAPHFALLKRIADRNGLPNLSMGMSDDFETAVQLGATHVRLGTAVFGPRPV
jgi:pyridoxal phosphate enzyme (YggS family)